MGVAVLHVIKNKDKTRRQDGTGLTFTMVKLYLFNIF